VTEGERAQITGWLAYGGQRSALARFAGALRQVEERASAL